MYNKSQIIKLLDFVVRSYYIFLKTQDIFVLIMRLIMILVQ